MESQRAAHARYALLEAELMSESESGSSLPTPSAAPLVLLVRRASVPVQVLPASRAPVRRAPAPVPCLSSCPSPPPTSWPWPFQDVVAYAVEHARRSYHARG